MRSKYWNKGKQINKENKEKRKKKKKENNREEIIY